MKKVILSLVFVAALTVVSCKEKEAEVVEETTTEVVEEVAAPVVSANTKATPKVKKVSKSKKAN